MPFIIDIFGSAPISHKRKHIQTPENMAEERKTHPEKAKKICFYLLTAEPQTKPNKVVRKKFRLFSILPSCLPRCPYSFWPGLVREVKRTEMKMKESALTCNDREKDFLNFLLVLMHFGVAKGKYVPELRSQFNQRTQNSASNRNN